MGIASNDATRMYVTRYLVTARRHHYMRIRMGLSKPGNTSFSKQKSIDLYSVRLNCH